MFLKKFFHKKRKMNDNKKKETTMALSKTAISTISAVIGIMITASTLLATFSYKTGITNNEIENIKENLYKSEIITNENIIKAEKDIKIELEKAEVRCNIRINSLEENKAEKDVVSMIFEKINCIEKKLDLLIINKGIK